MVLVSLPSNVLNFGTRLLQNVVERSDHGAVLGFERCVCWFRSVFAEWEDHADFARENATKKVQVSSVGFLRISETACESTNIHM